MLSMLKLRKDARIRDKNLWEKKCLKLHRIRMITTTILQSNPNNRPTNSLLHNTSNSNSNNMRPRLMSPIRRYHSNHNNLKLSQIQMEQILISINIIILLM